MLLIANPIYDSVFKALLEDLETARGFVSVLTGMKVVQLQLLAQEHAHRDSQPGEMKPAGDDSRVATLGQFLPEAWAVIAVLS